MHDIAITYPGSAMWLVATTLPHEYFGACTEIMLLMLKHMQQRFILLQHLFSCSTSTHLLQNKIYAARKFIAAFILFYFTCVDVCTQGVSNTCKHRLCKLLANLTRIILVSRWCKKHNISKHSCHYSFLLQDAHLLHRDCMTLYDSWLWQDREEGMQKFKQYLETNGQALSRTAEFTSYYALPFVPEPENHASFKELFTVSFSNVCFLFLTALLNLMPWLNHTYLWLFWHL